ncbi:Protein CBG14806 [Caenorhabditis briggsae]|nr:Protein CBG14806 [Caenorhabditis briggsae]CAP33229.1 Protein CBG14806 [Caenorhabditis briggsae]
MRQLIEPNAAASRRPSTFDPEVLAHHNSPPHWAPSSSVPGEQTTSTTTGTRTSFSGPSPFSSLCLSVLAATPQPRMINARIAMTVDAPSIRTENIRYFPKKGKAPKKQKEIPVVLVQISNGLIFHRRVETINQPRVWEVSALVEQGVKNGIHGEK